MTEKSLTRRSIEASAYNISSSALQTVIGLVRMLLLARLIEVPVFGIYTFAVSYIAITHLLPGLGMSSALVHRSEDVDEESALRTHFTLNLGTNLVWSLLLVALAPLFLPHDHLWIAWVFLATQVADHLVVTNVALLVRRVVFRRIAIVNLAAVGVGSLLALWLAWLGYGLWALLAIDIVRAVAGLVGYILFKPPWRVRLGWSSDAARYLLGFGYKALFASLLQDMISKVDNLWTGHYLGKEALGFYSRAYTFGGYPARIFASPIAGVVVGTYSALKGRRLQLSKAFFRANALIIRAGFGMSGALALVAPEFIRIVIGVKWMPMMDAFRLMLIFMMLDPIKGTVGGLFTAVGKPEKPAWVAAVQLVILAVGMYLLGPRFGIAGVAVALTIMVLTGISLLLWQAREFVDFSVLKLFGVPVLALGAGIGLGRLAITIPGVLGEDWRTAAVKLAVFSIVYGGSLLALEWRELLEIWHSRAQLWGSKKT